MQYTDVMTALFQIADTKEEAYRQKLASLPDDCITERKALKISANIAGNCAAFACIQYNGHTLETRRRLIFENHHYFDNIKPYLLTASAADADALVVFAHAVTMVRHCFYDRRMTELASDAAAGNAEAAFESGIITGVCRDILSAWIELWAKNGCVDCGGCDGCKI